MDGIQENGRQNPEIIDILDGFPEICAFDIYHAADDPGRQEDLQQKP